MKRISDKVSGIIRGINESKLPSGPWVIVLAVACVIALGVSGYLGWVALTSSKIAGCGGGRIFDCGHVISSRWSLWMGIPVSVLAFGLYATMGTMLIVGTSSRLGSRVRHAAWAIVTVLAMCAGVAAVWFIFLQVVVLQHLCTYCLAAHLCGLLTAEIVIRQKAIGENAKGLALMFGLVGLTILISGQLLGKAPVPYMIETFETPAVAPELFEFEAPGELDSKDDTLFEAPVVIDGNADSVFSPLPLSSSVKTWLLAIARPESLLIAQVTTSAQQESGGSPSGQTPAAAAAPSKSPSEATSQGQANAAVTAAQERRFVSINGGTVKLDVAQWPISGAQNAKYIFVEMFDYCCPHCRKTHVAVKGASEKLNGNLAVVMLPVPLNATCNNQIQVTDSKFVESCELAKLAIAVWRTDPTKFSEFHQWMFTGETAPRYVNAKAFAESLVDKGKLAAELTSQVPSQYIAKNVELYKRAGSGNVPKLMFPGTSVVGEFTSVDGLVDVIQREAK